MFGRCGLCGSKRVFVFQSEPFRRCDECFLVFKDPRVHVGPTEEKQRYSTHENHIENVGYVKFLTPVVEEVKNRLRTGAKGLDYGCGPGPVLATLLNRAGFETLHYDPHFFPFVLDAISDLDFVTCTEAAEHFFSPLNDFEKIFRLLKKTGILVLMTETYQVDVILKDWYYTRDPTHVCFYSVGTLQWIARQYHRSLVRVANRLAVFL